MNLRFEQPELLWLALLAIPLVLAGWRILRHMDNLRKWTTLTLRALLLCLIVFILAGPSRVQQHNQITVIGLVDISGSVRRFGDLPPVDETGRRSSIEYLRQWFRHAAQLRAPDDRFGLVAFDGEAVAISAPHAGDYSDDNLDLPALDGTNIADAIRLGMAMFPGDTAKRLVLATSGNQTIGDALEAARMAAGGDATGGGAGVPIDVLPLTYNVPGDVQIVRVEAPPTAQPGQTVTVRIILESMHQTTGQLTLRREGVPVDLNPNGPGHTRSITVPAGQSVQLANVTLGDTPINRFEAIFEADDPAIDVLPENNRAEAFVATPSRGSVLIVTNAPDSQPHGLATILQRGDIPVTMTAPQQFPDDLLSLQNYDLIVLDNIAAFDLTAQQQEQIVRYVDQLGGGLIKTGGERSFGAGGWNHTALADLLPVELDPPRELRAAPAGLVIVMDRSGSMNRPVGGARATQQEVANESAALAIESLLPETWIGVVVFDHMADIFIPLQRNANPREIADRIRTIRAMGGTRIQPALELGYDMLSEVDLQRRHMVLLTDGISHDPDMQRFVQKMAEQGVTITTIGVGEQIDDLQLSMIAEGTGGEFYHVRNPRILPRVLVDSVQEFNKPLIKEGQFQPVVRATGSMLTAGMDQAPPLGGLVITAPREDPLVSLDMVHPDGEPLLAHWQVGLGRVAAFTSDIDGRWSRRWTQWIPSQAFWTQLVRTIARAAVSPETELVTHIRDGQLHISLEAIGGPGEDERFLDYLQVHGNVYTPDGRSLPVRLRQTAPGRYETAVPVRAAGSYVVALNPRSGTRQLAPVIGGASLPTSEEFRNHQADLGLLREIVELTGGRWLDVHDPLAVNLFDRQNMPRSASFLPMWPSLLWWVLIVLLLDVASRRIAWNGPMVRAALAGAIERVTPARVRGKRAVESLATLQAISQRVERQQQDAKGITKFQATGKVALPSLRMKHMPTASQGNKPDHQTSDAPPPKPEPATADASTPTPSPQADKAHIGKALDAVLGRKSKSSEKTKPDTTPVDEKPADQSAQTAPADGAAMRSSLMEAKRRARRKLEEGQ